MTKMIDLQKKNDRELSDFIKEKRENMRQERFTTAGSKGRNVKAAREMRKDVARALTALRARP
ncbi:MAG TPA: 50S ribosomal protein L29 [Candidatus Paceibacterota bacterium]|nr:50S ribosomal protein L29 [Candidatus Paceibacterota bacterium]